MSSCPHSSPLFALALILEALAGMWRALAHVLAFVPGGCHV